MNHNAPSSRYDFDYVFRLAEDDDDDEEDGEDDEDEEDAEDDDDADNIAALHKAKTAAKKK